MKRWYLAASVVAALSFPTMMLAQGGGGGTGNGGGSGFGGGGGSGSSSGSSSGGLAGTANTTLLGNSVNLNFNSVFGTSATLANTTADNFAAYRPTGSGSSSGSSSSFSGGAGISNSGLGGGTGARTGSGTGGLSSGGMSGSLGTGGAAGGLGGNRGGLGGGLTSGGLGGGGLGGNRNTLGGGGNLGGGGFMGSTQGGMGMNNQQQNSTQGTMGYQVNYGGTGTGSLQGPVLTNLTPNVDFQQRLQASPGMQSASGLQVFTRGDTAILRGQVGSDYAKQLAAAMIRLEPGVYEVQNELVVVTPKQ